MIVAWKKIEATIIKLPKVSTKIVQAGEYKMTRCDFYCIFNQYFVGEGKKNERV